MINEKVLDEVLPVPELEELRDKKIEELKQEGFVITNFASGGIFYHLLMIVCRVRIELVQLLRVVLNNMFISHAQDVWVELKAADFSKKRKAAVKTQGYITISRDTPGEAVRIAKGYIFKTDQDINGEELRFFATEQAVLQRDALVGTVVVEAEKEGARYNVGPGQIKKCLIHLDGIDKIENLKDWIIKEGADIEDYESLRSRTLGAWAELSTLPIRDKYKNVCESVPGVLFVNVHDQHPRGQGTIDIIVTGTAGTATEGLLSDVKTAADSIKGPYDDILVKSSLTVSQDIVVEITINQNLSTDGMVEKAKAAIAQYMQIRKGRTLNELYLFDVACAVKNVIEGTYPYKNIRVTTPAEDVILETDKVIILGTCEVTLKIKEETINV
ncbi:baseplate J/gp47 family protein [Hungatella effluvii]|uniref:baseplate J/gp47 family protein n=1 Tax=Hungatella effluvii TaxID=1096246 RepID=UPI0022E0AE85|nr:baseplate J/gp47 family protein [Hungatella effluvii]